MDSEESAVLKKNSAFIYGLNESESLSWPSLTTQWRPSPGERENNADVYQLLLGTHTDEEENKLIVMDIEVRENDFQNQDITDDNACKYAREACIGTVKSMMHIGDVNRARYMPQNDSIIATRSSENDSYIYNENGIAATLKGHSDEGYGLSWSPHQKGILLTSSYDKSICLWDVNHVRAKSSVITPTSVINGHTDKVEDVAWHPKSEGIFASVSDDKYLFIWDIRSPLSPSLRTMAHDGDVNCLSWHPITSHLVLTGGSDECVYLWDNRKLVSPLHTFEEEAAVYRVLWSPLQETMFVSSGLHRRIHLWDVANIGDDVLSQEEEGGPSELSLIHSSHSDNITDLDWHPQMPWTLASCSEDNMLNIWQVNSHIFDDYH